MRFVRSEFPGITRVSQRVVPSFSPDFSADTELDEGPAHARCDLDDSHDADPAATRGRFHNAGIAQRVVQRSRGLAGVAAASVPDPFRLGDAALRGLAALGFSAPMDSHGVNIL